MKTGYFARASEGKQSGRWTKVHIVHEDNKPVCAYRPHKTMRFQFCAGYVYDPYVECTQCRAWSIKQDELALAKKKKAYFKW